MAQKSDILSLFMFCFQACKKTKWAAKKAIEKGQYYSENKEVKTASTTILKKM